MHTWGSCLEDFVFLRAVTGSTDLVRVEGAMNSGLSSFSVKISLRFWVWRMSIILIGERTSVAVVAVVGGFSSSLDAPSACTCPKERQIDCFTKVRLDPANTSCLNLLQCVHRLMLIFPLPHTR